MSVMLKDDLIKACADAYRTASGTTESVKAGELAGLISALATSGGGDGVSNLYIGYYTPSEDVSSIDVTHGLGTTDILLAAIFAESIGDVEVTSIIGGAQIMLKTDYPQRSSSANTIAQEKLVLNGAYYGDGGYSRTQNASATTTPVVVDENTVQFNPTGNTSYSYKTGVTYTVVIVAAEEVSA